MTHQTDDATDETQSTATPTDSTDASAESSDSDAQAVPDTGPDVDRASFPIVGIGASAGGLEAFEKFFTHMPSDSGMAFVLVQHLDPTHDSMLVDIIRRYTRMHVLQVEDGMEIKPDTIYIIPPNRDMSLLQRTLYLTEPEAARGMRLPIDFFFRSLADDLHERAICIILSGTGTDGTLGMRAIKGEGGMAMVQSPSSAKYDGMPQNAIATGLVDYTLPPDDMPQQLTTYVRQEFVPGKRRAEPVLSESSDSLQKVFLALRSQTGHDFSQYKPSTIMRRIERRMTVNQIGQIHEYARYLRQNPLEIDTLFRELLIGVTSFFRDPEAFDVLKQKAIPALFEHRSPRQPVRVWVPGCSTGEEAYSLAIVLREYMNQTDHEYTIQVFATDIDNQAVEKARAGIYPDSIAADVSAERLQQFFSHEGNSFHVRQHIREMVIFAVQNVTKDPPFSSIDLLSCRNLLIYMSIDLQKRVLPLFHYALKPGGMLFLGTSETPGESTRLFATIDRKLSIFQRPPDDDIATMPPGFAMQEEQHQARAGDSREEQPRRSLRELAEQALIEQYAPPGVIIDEQGEILYFHGKTGKYLEPASGEASFNLFRMAREELQIVLPTVVREATAQKSNAIRTGIQVQTNGEMQIVNIRVTSLQRNLLLVIFEEVTSIEPTALEDTDSESSNGQDERIRALQQELKSTKEYLQTTIEELQSSNEEVKSSNEELQSSNEELQSTNEELETSKEELQSVNEELMTVNTELRNKNEQLSQVNNDLKNLLASMEVGTVFLDKELHILRFTPAAQDIFNVLESDIGRPLHHLTSTIVTVNLVEVAESVLNDLQTREQEVQNQEGTWFMMRAQPYRTTENVVDGVVMTFGNITQQKQVQAELYQQQQWLQGIYHEISVPIFVLHVAEDGDFYYADVNPADERLTGYSRDMLIGKRNQDLDPPLEPEQVERARAYYRQCVEQGNTIMYEQRMDMVNGEYWWAVQLTPLKDEQGQVYQIIGTAQPITEKRRLQATLQRVSDLAAQLPQWHQAIHQQHDDAALARAWSDLLVQIEGIRLARVGLGDPEQPDQPIAHWAEQRAEDVPAPDDVPLDAQGAEQVAAAAIQSDDLLVIEDIVSDAAYAPWHEVAQACGFVAVGALALRWHEQVLGVVVVGAATPELFDPATRAMLHHLADMLACGLAARQSLD
jgi:two-component system CheB/CheR fusion protein